MRHAFYLAWRHLAYHWGRSTLLVVALALSGFLPIALRQLIDAGGRAMIARAESTPLVVGARGSELDLVVASLYFAPPAPRAITMGDRTRLEVDDNLVVPLHLGYTARKRPVVGTTLDYFTLRERPLASGRLFALLGECVVGSRVARDLGLVLDADGDGPNDPPLLTDAIDPYNLAGTIPLKLHVAGILASSGTADDDAIFVDIKTAWTVSGLGHGHQEAAAIKDPNDLIGNVEGHVVASERLKHYEEITPSNAASFHFHGDPDSFPVHAFLVRPSSERASTLLQGTFQRSDEPLAIVKPSSAIDRLLREILRVRRVLEAVLVAVLAATLTMVGVVFTLSIRLRHDELATMVRLGAARGTIASMVIAEVLALAAIATLLGSLGLATAQALAPAVERQLLSLRG